MEQRPIVPRAPIASVGTRVQGLEHLGAAYPGIPTKPIGELGSVFWSIVATSSRCESWHRNMLALRSIRGEKSSNVALVTDQVPEGLRTEGIIRGK